MANTKATPKTAKLNLTILATSLSNFVDQLNGLNVTPEQQQHIDEAMEAFFNDVGNTLEKTGKDEITIADFVSALKAHGIKIQINGLKNENLGTVIKTLSPTSSKFDWKAFGITVLKYTAMTATGVAVGYYGTQYVQNRRNARQAAEAHRSGSNVTSITAQRRAA